MEQEEYVGFTFNGTHSSDLGIYRVLDGDRIEEKMSPDFKRYTIKKSGKDGQYYYGSTFTKRTFPTINFAFTNLSTAQFNELKKFLGDRKIHILQFDEKPLVKYFAKISNSVVLNYLSFSKTNTNYYSGEGQIEFVSYFPFGYTEAQYNDWIATNNNEDYDSFLGRIYTPSELNSQIYQNQLDIQQWNNEQSESSTVELLDNIFVPLGNYALKFSNDGTVKKYQGDYIPKIMLTATGKSDENTVYRINDLTGNVFSFYIEKNEILKIDLYQNLIYKKDRIINNRILHNGKIQIKKGETLYSNSDNIQVTVQEFYY